MKILIRESVLREVIKKVVTEALEENEVND